MYIFAVIQIRVLVRLAAAATIQERRLFCSALAQVRLLFDTIEHNDLFSQMYVAILSP